MYNIPTALSHNIENCGSELNPIDNKTDHKAFSRGFHEFSPGPIYMSYSIILHYLSHYINQSYDLIIFSL